MDGVSSPSKKRAREQEASDDKESESASRDESAAAAAAAPLSKVARVDAEEEEDVDLYWACRNGKLLAIARHLDGGEDVNQAVHPRGSTPVLVASYFDQAKAVAYLLERGGDPAPEECNQTALHLAAHRGARGAARALLESKQVGVDAPNDEDETPLFVAAHASQDAMVKLLIEEFKADVERPSGANGLRPLHIAAELGSVGCATHLLANGASVDAVDAAGETALYKATEADRLGSVILLLRHGADAAKRVPEHGRFPLFAACERGRDLDVVAALAGCAPNLNQATDNGYTSLYVAARYNLADVVRLLLSQGADPNCENKYGETPLFAACRENHDAVVRVLLKHPRTEINCMSLRWSRGSPLHVAAALDHIEVAKRLLGHNAEIRAVARDPASLLHIVCSNGFLGGTTLNYADVDQLDADGHSPLALALDNDHLELARVIFLEYDAKPPVNFDELLGGGDNDQQNQHPAGGADDHSIVALAGEEPAAAQRQHHQRRPRAKLFNRIVKHWHRRRRRRTNSHPTLLDVNLDETYDLHINENSAEDDDDDDEDDSAAALG
ncbi:hypothetical protein CTAYLR_009141 [Chrysophaeum taylorii]|uniref:Uncharacterized protein n=1 Tax=Chrysophaeum taylorii TaxID=2483200 RepID=A0AAD7UKV1_9STRA|nr:hypothetical protein CTAYLR_009141 [Chrysophaeum taylorii]